jgi:chromosome segregation ATPase
MLAALREDWAARLDAQLAAAREAQSDRVAALQGEHEQALARVVEEIEARYGDEANAAYEAYQVDQQGAREAHERDLAALTQAHDEELSRLRTEAAALQAQARAHEREGTALQARSVELEGQVAMMREAQASRAGELESLRKSLAETANYRDQYARRLATAMEQVRVVSAQAREEAEVFSRELRGLGALVGRLTSQLIVQGASLSAQRSGRGRPDPHDIDEAISQIADDVPETVSDELWAARDALLAQAQESW